MGNILTQERHNRAGQKFDDLEYHYQTDSDGNLLRNRLYSVSDDPDLASVMEDDIEDMDAFISAVDQINTNNNYSYDAEGRLVKDKQEEIDTIIWTVSGKVKEIRRTLQSTKKNLIFEYDTFGNRIAKHVYDNESLMLERSTYYILDAQGNQLSMYEHAVDDTEVNYYLTERNIYGSSRLGTLKDPVNMFDAKPLPSYGILGNRNYELSNHLGNVLTVISDIKYPLSSDNTTIDSYEVGISNIFDYSPFGAPLDGRTLENFIAPIFDSIYVEEVDANYSSDFNASNYVLPTYDGWSATNGDNVALGITNNRLRIESTATSQGAQKRFSTQSGRKVYVSFNLDKGTASQVEISAEDVDSQNNYTLNKTESYSSNGVKTFVFTAQEDEFNIEFTANGTFFIEDVVIKDSTFMLVDFTDFENPVYIEPLVDKWTYNPKNTKVYFENSAFYFLPKKDVPITRKEPFSATVSPSNTYRVIGSFTFENTANSQKSVDLMLYRLNTSGTAFVDSTVVATITGDGAFNYILPINVSASYVIGWKTSKAARFKLTSYRVAVTVASSYGYSLSLQIGNFNNPDIVTPSYDGWTINPKTEFLAYSDISTNCLSISRGLRKDFITETNANYKFSGDVKYLGSSVFIPPIFGMSDNEEDNVPQISNRLDSLKITDISSTPVRITGVQFNGTTQIEKNFQATSNATQIEFLLGSVLEIGYAYYADNLKLEKIGGGSTIYTSNFTNQEIVSVDLDGWKTNWETSYLSATTDTPSKFRVAGETPQTNRLFNVTPGLEYELIYTQTDNNAVDLLIEESANGTSWQSVVSNASSNGSQTVSFIPSASLLKVSFEASGSFKLQDISLNGELFDTLVVAKMLGGTGYRYGFNGMEKDDKIKGEGNSYTTEFRQYDPRVGRWLSIDPLFANFPWQSPYVAFDNNPVFYKDPKGLAAEGNGNKDKINKKRSRLIQRRQKLKSEGGFMKNLRIKIINKRLGHHFEPIPNEIIRGSSNSTDGTGAGNSIEKTETDVAPRQNQLGYRAITVNPDGTFNIFDIGKPAGSGGSSDPFAPVWTNEGIEVAKSVNPKASAGLKDGDNVIVSPNGDIVNGVGETIIPAPKGVSQYSGLFRENEMIYRVNNAGTVTAEYSRAASNTIVNFYKVEEKDSSGNTKFTWIEKQGFTNIKDVSK